MVDAHYYPRGRSHPITLPFTTGMSAFHSFFFASLVFLTHLFLQIAERPCDGSHTLSTRMSSAALRSLNMQLFIEKWLQIIQRITLIEPRPGGQLLSRLDDMFQELQVPFAHFKAGSQEFPQLQLRVLRLFQRLGCAEFSMFFLDQRQAATRPCVIDSNTQTGNSPQLVPSFAVRLDNLSANYSGYRKSLRNSGCATVPAKMEFRKSDLHPPRLDRQTSRAQRRSTHLNQTSNTWTMWRLPYASATEPQPLRRSRPLRRLG